jgi:iron complex outermembrane receptor protein
LRARVDARFESAWYADYIHNRGTRQAPEIKEDLSLTYEAPQGWTIGAWCKNVSNKAVIGPTAAAGIPGPATSYLEPPRTFGARVTVSF